MTLMHIARVKGIILTFSKGNLNGQTAIRVGSRRGAPKRKAVQGFGEFALPDRITAEDELAQSGQRWRQGVGVQPPAR